MLRACVRAPRAVAGSDITAQRLVLVADLLARAAELSGLQVLTALDITGLSPAQAAAIASDADALGVHPPAARVSCLDAPSSLGGPVDVHVVSQNAGADPGRAGQPDLSACAGTGIQQPKHPLRVSGDKARGSPR